MDCLYFIYILKFLFYVLGLLLDAGLMRNRFSSTPCSKFDYGDGILKLVYMILSVV